MSLKAIPALIGIESHSSAWALERLLPVGAALQKQAQRDFAPIWHASATITVFPVGQIPTGYWPFRVRDKLDDPDALGYHEDRDGEPYAEILATDDLPLTLSHELLEALADPWGRRKIRATSPQKGEGYVKVLEEVCDPCENADYGYEVDGYLLSDFVLPSYYGPRPRHPTGRTYSFTGVVKTPRTLLPGGYVSWQLFNGHWKQMTYFGAEPAVRTLGRQDTNESPREWIDRLTREHAQRYRRDAQRTD